MKIETANVDVAIVEEYVPENHVPRINTAEFRAFVAQLEEEEEVIIQEIPVAGWKGQ